VAFLAVVDACALYPYSLRDTLLRLAEIELYDIQWSDRIIDEMRRNLVENVAVPEERADRMVNAMNNAFEGATVASEPIALLEHAMTNDEKDRHVLAAAVVSRSEIIVTFNVKHFPEAALEPLGVEAVHPDDFLQTLLAIDAQAVVETLRQQAADMVDPPFSFDELLGALDTAGVPEFVALVRTGLASGELDAGADGPTTA
jgi:predicted nucleic acid-binding protein